MSRVRAGLVGLCRRSRCGSFRRGSGAVGLCRSLGWISFRWFSGVSNFQGASGVVTLRRLRVL
mgnify:CR=1 FL=1